MKRAGGGFDYSYNAQTAVDESHHIIVAVQVVNTSTDVQQLPMVLDEVQAHAGVQPAQVLADAGYRSKAVMAKLAQSNTDTELVIALGERGQGTGCAQRRQAANLAVGGIVGMGLQRVCAQRRQAANLAGLGGLQKAQTLG